MGGGNLKSFKKCLASVFPASVFPLEDGCLTENKGCSMLRTGGLPRVSSTLTALGALGELTAPPD